jgi:hypothetical protein
MIDLSSMFDADPVAALCPTGQTTGAQADNRNARTAPGTVPAAPHADQPAVVVGALEHQRAVIEDGHDTSLDGGKPVLNTDEWTNTPGRSYNSYGPAGTAAALRASNPGR